MNVHAEPASTLPLAGERAASLTRQIDLLHRPVRDLHPSVVRMACALYDPQDDIFDALTSHRPYKPAWPVHEAIAEMRKLVRMGRLDADCVEALARNTETIGRIRAQFPQSPRA